MKRVFFGLAVSVWLVAAGVQAKDAPSAPAAWSEGPSQADVAAAWPVEAKRHGISGLVVLDCAVDELSALNGCKVSKEDPLKFGFGEAALSLAPKVRLRPDAKKTSDGRSLVVIRFPKDDGDSADIAADWVKAPSVSDLETVWPTAANGMGGRAVIDCLISVEGTASACKSIWEKPEGKGFGTAALLLAPSFLFKPAMKDGHPIASHVEIPINWEGPSGIGGAENGPSYRMVTSLPWIAAPSAADLAKVYPRRAREKALSGHVVIRCALANDGTLKDCVTITQEPAGAGFGDAALSLAKAFKSPVGNLDKRVIATVRINLAIQFTPPVANAQPRMLTNFEWTRELNPDAVLDAFPGKAVDAGVSTGRVVLDCTIDPSGALTACAPLSESPGGMDFGAAATKVAQLMAVNPWTQDGLPADGAHVRFAIRFVQAAQKPSDGAPPPTPPAPAVH